MSFSNPLALGLLLAVPYFAWLGWPRIAYRRPRDTASLLLRLLIVVLLVLALSGVQVVQSADKLSTVFLIDASDSIDSSARAQAEKYVRDAMSQMGSDDRAGIVVFGKNALVERPVSIGKDPGPITSVPVRLDTNIAEAIRLALAMFPPDTARRIVLLSDGQETVGNAAEAARLAAASNVQIDTVPLGHKQGPEVLVSDVRLPTTVNQGETFDLGVTVQSTTATSADLTILASGAVIQSKRVDLKVGDNNYVLSMTAPKQGFSDFEVKVDTATGTDTFYQNNTLSGFTDVTGPPRILLVSAKPEEVAALLPALQQQGIQVDIQGPGDLPIGLAPLAGYKAVVLANVSAIDLSDQRMKVLQSYVRDLGGGLVAIGGPNSYGAGGYLQTPLEETLPVDSRIKDQKRLPSLLMVYVIDRSGSMEMVENNNTVDNLELAKEAARRSLQYLFPRDRAGVLSFDSDPQWLVPIQQVSDRTSMERDIGTLRPGGGTDILAAVKEIYKTVPPDQSTLKHVVLLTDGGADPTGIVDLVRQMHDQYGVTITSIGIGSEVPSFMADIATAGHGVYYNVTNAATLPQVFAADTVLTTRSYIIEQEFTPVQSANSQIMQGLADAQGNVSLPTLKGYIATTPKDTATTILTAPGYNDPLLAAWQYGLGRAVAWTSDATTRWAANWTSWSDFGRFWSQVIRWTITEGANNQVDAHVEQRGDQTVLVVDARDDNGAYLNSLALDAAIIDPKLQPQALKLKQVAPGRYEVPFDPQTQGAYFIRIGGTGTSGSNIAVAQTSGWVLSYSPEYRLRDTNVGLLDDVTRLTGGTVITDKPELAFEHSIRETRSATPLWPWALLLAAILLPIDIAVRRVIISRSDVVKAAAWARERLGLDRQPVPVVSSGRLTRLMDAKDRAMSSQASQSAAQPTAQPTDVRQPSAREAVPSLLRKRRDGVSGVSGGAAGTAVSTGSTGSAAPAPQASPSPVAVQTPESPRPAAAPARETAVQERSPSGSALASRLVDSKRRGRGDRTGE